MGLAFISFLWIGIQLMKQFGVWAILLILGIVWGATMPLTKIAVSTGHQPFGLIFWQLIFGVAILAPVAFARRMITGSKITSVLSFQTLIYFLMISLLGTLVPNSFSYVSAVHLQAGVMSIIIASEPMFALIIALALGLEKPLAIRIIGVLSGAVAVVLLIGPETSLPDPEKAIYVVVALLAPISYAIEGNYIVLRAPKHIDPVITLLGASLLGVIIVGPLVIFTGTWVDLTVEWQAPEWALLVSSMLHVIAYAGYIWLLGISGVVFASQIAYVVTIAGVFISAIALNESYSSWVWAALALMVFGLALVHPRKNAF